MNLSAAKRALEIVDGAHGLTESELETYLESVCGEDSLLRQEVLDYLKYDKPQTVFADCPAGANWPELPSIEPERYQLGEEIARGGMGVVLHAFDSNLRRQVAVKILTPEAENKPDIVRRFLLEAHVGGQLQHPGIAPVYAVGRLADGRPFIAMKLVNGVTLQSLLKQQQDPADDPAEFLGIFEQVCQAIAFAHGRGVIHRDLKPANVMVGEFGEVQVMDWGIAKLLGDVQSSAAVTDSEFEFSPAGTASVTSMDTVETVVQGSQIDSGGIAGQTQLGVGMGTPAYMPPEQAIGRSDRMSDVFSLGAMLCEILTGEPTAGDLAAARDRLDRCTADKELCELAKACIEHDPADRPADAGVVATRISDYLNAIQSRLKNAEIATARAEVRAEEERRRRRRTLWTIAAVGLLLLLASIAGPMIAVHQAKLRREADQQRDSAVAAREEKARAMDLAVRRAEENRRNLYLAEMNLASLTTQEFTSVKTVREMTRKWIPEPGETDLRGWEWHYLDNLYRYDLFSFDGHRDEVGAVEYSPDGTRAASLDRSGTLCVWSAADGAEILTRDVKAHYWSPVRWSPAGDELAFFDRDHHLIRLDSESGEVKMNVPYPRATPMWLVWSPDGKRFAMGRRQDSAALIVNAENGDIEHVIATGFRDFGGFAWGPEGSELAVSSLGAKWAIWDADTGSSDPIRRSGETLRYISWSPDGKHIAGEGNARGIRVVDTESMEGTDNFPGHFNFILSVAWSDDSQRVISSSWDYSVRIWKLGQQREQLVVPCVEGPFRVSWNSANQNLAITEGDRVRVVDGTRQTLHRWWVGRTLLDVRWSPDGSRVLGADNAGTVRVWDAETMSQVAEFKNGTGNAARSACWSPDGNRIASATTDIVIWDVAGGTELIRLDGHRSDVWSVDWSPDGSRLASCGQDGKVRVWDTDSGKELGTYTPEGTSFNRCDDLRWSPDPEGSFLAVSSQKPRGRVSILDSETLKPLKSFESQGQEVCSLAWNPDGTRIAIGSIEGVQIFDPHSGSLHQDLRGHEGDTNGIGWSPDGRRLASGGADRMVRVWDVETGQVALTIRAGDTKIDHLDWTRDGSGIVSAEERHLSIWDGRVRSDE